MKGFSPTLQIVAASYFLSGIAFIYYLEGIGNFLWLIRKCIKKWCYVFLMWILLRMDKGKETIKGSKYSFHINAYPTMLRSRFFS